MWLYAFLSFRAMVSAGMNLPLHGASERSSRNLPSEWFLPIMADFTIIPFFPLITLLTLEGAHLPASLPAGPVRILSTSEESGTCQQQPISR